MYQDSVGTHAFLYSSGSVIDLMPGTSSFVSGTSAINDLGQVAGGFDANGVTHAFVYADGRAVDIGTLGGDYSVALAISGTGKATGIAARADGERHAFLYAAGAMSDLGTLGGTMSIGYALNDADQVAGQSLTASGALHAFVVADGAAVDLGQLVEALHDAGEVGESAAFGINPLGIVIGRYALNDPNDAQMPVKDRAFIATPVAALLQTLIAQVTGVGPGKGLLKKLEHVLTSYTAGDQRKTCSALAGVLKELNKHHGKKLDPAMAAQLREEAGAVENALACH
jgi:probable HAF family extracellular repeat protein